MKSSELLEAVTKNKSGLAKLDRNLYLFVYDEDDLTELEQQGYSGISDVYFSHGLGVINTKTQDYLLAYADYSDDGIIKYHTNLDDDEDIFDGSDASLSVFADMDDIASLTMELEEKREEGDDDYRSDRKADIWYEIVQQLEPNNQSVSSWNSLSHLLKNINEYEPSWLRHYARQNPNADPKQLEAQVKNITARYQQIYNKYKSVLDNPPEDPVDDNDVTAEDILDEINDLVRSLKKQYPSLKLNSADDIA